MKTLVTIFDPVTGLSEEKELEFDEPVFDIEELKKQKLNEISKACEDIITQGIDLDNEHFSLTQNDQINIGTLYNAAQQGAENLLYHADGELCRYFTSSEIVALFGKVAQHKMYHTTYCNHINAWIRRAETAEEINAIQYGDELPADLQEHFNEILGAMTNDG